MGVRRLSACYLPSLQDLYISVDLVRARQLRSGDMVEGAGAPRAADSGRQVPAERLDAMRRLRRVLGAQPGGGGIELLLERMSRTAGNAEFLQQIRLMIPTT